MRHRITCVAVVTLLVNAARPLAAQAPDGSRVRVSTRSGAQVVGTLVSTRADGVSVRPEGRPDAITMALDSVSTLEVSGGPERHTGRGFLIGAGTGVVLGAALGAATYHDCQQCFMDFGRGADAVAGGLLGGVVGGVIGAVVGSQPHESWRSVPVARGGGASLLPSFGRGRVALVAKLRF